MCGEKYRLALFHETVDGVPLEEPLYLEYIFTKPSVNLLSLGRGMALDMIFEKLHNEAKHREFGTWKGGADG